MIKMASAAAAVLLLGMTGSSADTLRLSAKSGQSIVIKKHVFWNDRCTADSFTIKILDKIVGGSVSTKPANVKLDGTMRVGSGNNCAGKTLKGKALIYKSKPNFKGKEKFTYKVTGSDGSFRNTVIITVK